MPIRPVPRTMREVSTPSRRNSPTGASAIGWAAGSTDKRGRQAELRDGNGDVGLAAAERGHKLRALQEALHARRRQAEHDLTEGNDGFQHSGNDIVSGFAPLWS